MEFHESKIQIVDCVNENDITTWTLPKGAIARLGRGDVNDIAFSPDLQYLAVATDIGIWLYTLPTISPIALWDTDNGHTGVITFSPDSCLLAAYSDNEETLKIWNVESGICVAHMEDSYQPDSWKPRFSPDSKHLLGGPFEWCANTGELLDETDFWHPHPNNAASHFTLCSDGSLVIGERFNNSDDHTEIVVWHAETGEEIAVLSVNSEEHTLAWWNPCFSPCKRYLAASDSQGALSVWELDNGTLLNTYTDFGDADIYPIYSQNSTLLAAVVLPQKVEIWNVEKHEIIDAFSFNNKHIKGYIVCFSVDATQLAVSVPNELTLWTKGKNGNHSITKLNGHTDTADSIAFSHDGKTLGAAYWAANVILWDVENKLALKPSGEKLPGIRHAVFSNADGQFITAGGDYKDTLWLSTLGSQEKDAEFNAYYLGTGTSKDYSPTANRLACADDDFIIHIWECNNSENHNKKIQIWEKLSTLHGHTGYIRALAFNSDGKKLVSISATIGDQKSRDARLWDVDTGDQITELSFPQFKNTSRMYREWDMGVAFSHCGNLIAGGQYGEIVLWDATNGETIMTIPQPDGSKRPIALRFFPCGNFLASGAWWQPGLKLVSVRIWEIASSENIVTFWSHTTDVQDLQFSPDGTTLASAGHDGVIYLWDLKPYL